MNNIYEFKIEDIDEVKSILKNDRRNYRIVYRRVYEKGQPTLQFKESHYALPTNEKNRVGIMCEHCGTINRIKRDKYERKNFKFHCGNCNNKEIFHDETFIKNEALRLVKEEFDNRDIYINDTYII